MKATLGLLIAVLLPQHSIAASPQERSTAVQSCVMSIMDSAARDYAKRAGQDPNRASGQEMAAKLKAAKPQAYDSLTASCSCTIDFAIRNGVRLTAQDVDAMFKKQGERLRKECPPPRL